MLAAAAVLLIMTAGSLGAQEARDTSRSTIHFDGSVIRELPVDRIEDLVRLRAGTFSLFGGDYRFRAGARGDEVWFMDGVPVSSWLLGMPLFRPPVNGVASLDVTNLPSAAYADALGGAVDVRSRIGDRNTSFDLRFQTDELIEGVSLGSTRMDAFVDGGIGSNMFFSVAASAQGNRSPQVGGLYRNVPLYERAGVDTIVTIVDSDGTRDIEVPAFREIDGRRVPFSANDQLSVIGRIDYLRGATNGFATVTASRFQAREPLGNFCGCAMYNFESHAGTQAKTLGLTVGLDRAFSPRLSVAARVSYQRDRLIGGVLDPDFEAGSREPTLGFAGDFRFLVDNDAFPINENLIDRVIHSVGTRTPLPPESTNARSVEYRTNPYGILQTFSNRGIGGLYTYGEESRVFAGANARYRVANQDVVVGIEAATTNMAFARMQYFTTANGTVLVESPRRLALHATDRMRVGNASIEAGIRLDRFDPNTEFPVTPGYVVDESLREASVENAIGWSLVASMPILNRHSVYIASVRSNRMPDGVALFGPRIRDYFRFRNAAESETFGRPVGHQSHTTIEFGGTAGLIRNTQLDVALYRVSADRAAPRRIFIDDPTNPGATAYLNVLHLVEATAGGADVSIGSAPASPVQWRLSYAWLDSDDQQDSTGVQRVDVFTERHPSAPSVAVPFGSRHTASAYAAVPFDIAGGRTVFSTIASAASGFSGARSGLPKGWIYSMNLRVAHEVNVFGRSVRFIADGRDVFARSRISRVPDTTIQVHVEANRYVLGAGNLIDAIDLSTLESSTGIRNEVDLAALRGAERRFGNGDGIFDAEEQNRAFAAAMQFIHNPHSHPAGALRLGVEMTF